MNDELTRLRQNGESGLAEVLSSHRNRLLRMVRFRQDQSLRGRIDPEDILQEAYIKIAGRLQDYLRTPNVSFYVWARQITWQIVIDIHRAQMGLKRNPSREARVGRDCGNSTASSIAHSLIGSLTSPSVAAMRQEQIDGLHAALDSMDEIDREVLALRHFEHLENGEVAEVLELSRTAASNRYVRALARTLEKAADLAAGIRGRVMIASNNGAARDSWWPTRLAASMNELQTVKRNVGDAISIRKRKG